MYFDKDVISIIKSYHKDIYNYNSALTIINDYFNKFWLYHKSDNCNIDFELFKYIHIEYKFNRYNLIRVNIKKKKWIILLNINHDSLNKYTIYKIEKDIKDNVYLYLK